MNTIDLSNLIPQTEENKEVLVAVYKSFQKNYSNAVAESNKLLIEFIKQIYPDSYRLYCKNTYLLEGNSKKFYLSLINAGALDVAEKVDIYLKYQDRRWWVRLLDIGCIPALPLVKAFYNMILKSQFNYKQLALWLKVDVLFRVYLTAGYDVEFSSGLLEGKIIKNPYDLLKKEFNDRQLQSFKEMDKISDWELIFDKERAEKLFSNLVANLREDLIERVDEKDVDQTLKEILKKMKRYQVFRGYWNQVLSET